MCRFAEVPASPCGLTACALSAKQPDSRSPANLLGQPGPVEPAAPHLQEGQADSESDGADDWPPLQEILEAFDHETMKKRNRPKARKHRKRNQEELKQYNKFKAAQMQ